MIALEILQEMKKNIIIFGVYRQWGNQQLEEIESLHNAIDKAAKENKHIVAMGNFNVDAKRMNDKTYRHKRICDAISEMNDTNDLKMAELPETYFQGNISLEAPWIISTTQVH